MGINQRPVYMARQPIYSVDGAVVGYELLFRRAHEGGAGNLSRSETAMALVNALVEIGLDRLVGDSVAYINVTEDLLLEDCLAALPKERVVLEILETVQPTPEIVRAVTDLKAHGYTIALDDFTRVGDLAPLVELASIVKVDVPGVAPSELGKLARQLKGPGRSLLAEKVEDRATYARCRNHGFDLFQGYYFMKPKVVEGQGMKTNRVSLLRLLAKLQDPDIRLNDLEEVIRADVTLSYRLIKLTNTVDVALRTPVQTVGQAIHFLGLRKVTSMATLLTLAGADDIPQELVVTAFTRAHMCENLARARHMAEPSKMFLAGLLSFLDAILSMPIEEALQALPLSDELREALIAPDADNDVAALLREVRAYEVGRFDALRDSTVQAHATDAYLSAVKWSEESEALAA